MTHFDAALEDCVEALHHGASVAACLARYPEHSERLAPLLGVAAALYEAPREVMSADGFETQHARLRAALQVRHATRVNGHRPSVNGYHPSPNGRAHPAPAPAPRGWAWRWAWLTGSRRFALMMGVLVAAVAIGLAGSTIASATTHSEPEQPLYTVKRAVEVVRLWLPADTEARTLLALELAERRLTEAQRVCDSNQRHVPTLLAQLREYTAEADRRLGEIPGGPGATALRLRVARLNSAADTVEQQCRAAPPVATEAPAAAPAVAPLPTDTDTPTATASATATASRVPTRTPTPSATATNTANPPRPARQPVERAARPTATDVPTATAEPSPTPVPPRPAEPTSRREPTRAPTDAPSATPRPTGVPATPTSKAPTPTAGPRELPTKTPPATRVAPPVRKPGGPGLPIEPGPPTLGQPEMSLPALPTPAAR